MAAYIARSDYISVENMRLKIKGKRCKIFCLLETLFNVGPGMPGSSSISNDI